jgi:hypothetical protein
VATLEIPNGCDWNIFCLFFGETVISYDYFFAVFGLFRVIRRRDVAGMLRNVQKSNGTKHKNANIAVEVVRQGVPAQQVAGMCAIFRRTAFVGVHVHAHKVGRPSRNHHQETMRSSRTLRWVPEAMCLECWVACGQSRDYCNYLFLFPDWDFDSFTE